MIKRMIDRLGLFLGRASWLMFRLLAIIWYQ